jgi:hypothetical protein
MGCPVIGGFSGSSDNMVWRVEVWLTDLEPNEVIPPRR